MRWEIRRTVAVLERMIANGAPDEDIEMAQRALDRWAKVRGYEREAYRRFRVEP